MVGLFSLATGALAIIAWVWSRFYYEAVTFVLRKRQHRIESWNGYLTWYRWNVDEVQMYNLWTRLPPNSEQQHWAALERMELGGIETLKTRRIPYWVFVWEPQCCRVIRSSGIRDCERIRAVRPSVQGRWRESSWRERSAISVASRLISSRPSSAPPTLPP